MFVELLKEDYPFTVEIFEVNDADGKEPIFMTVVTGAGVLELPARGPEDPYRWVRVTWPNGEVREVGRPISR